MAIKTINLTPDPRILRMLGQIELSGWKCVAEIIDNSIDAMLKLDGSDREKHIDVYVPTRPELKNDEPLRIRDNGIGMNEEELENCLRAGYTSQGGDESLGLFGMGFNIATARLGDVVDIWTSTESMANDIGVKIDLVEMQQTKSFDRELMKRPKSIIPSGTLIEIAGYHPRAAKLLNRAQIIENINKTYSKSLIEDYGITIRINNQLLKPFTFCTWDEGRYVEHKGEQFPAVLSIHNKFMDRYFCSRCFLWLESVEENKHTELVCSNCSSSDRINRKKIEVRGWVGIQRYNDPWHYGINIIRNGRIIKQLDKSLFTWQDRYNRNNGQSIFEYPIDTQAAGGRIVGEIRADFIIPTYTKDSFEETDAMWLNAVEAIRGEAPFQPQIATKKLKFKKNKSPLAKLFQGYRRSSPPGKRWLIPGTSKGKALYQAARDWAESFYAGEPEYQDDSIWWQAVEVAELREEEGEGDPTEIPGTTTETPKEAEEGHKDPFPGKKIHVYSKVFNLESILGEKPIEITVIDYWPQNGFPTPIIFEAVAPSKFNVYINNKHDLFKDFADGWQDLVMMEVASRFFQRIDNPADWPLSRIYYELKIRYAAETMLNVDELVKSAKSLMKEIQNHLSIGNVGITLKPKPKLTNSELMLLKQNYLKAENRNLNKVDDLLRTTEFLKYMDLRFIFKFISKYPRLLFDGLFFDLPLETLDQDMKDMQLEQYIGHFNDLKWFIYEMAEYPDGLVKKQKNMIIRNRFSLDYLDAHRAS